MISTITLQEPPKTVPCLLCLEDCSIKESSDSTVEYHCLRHEPLVFRINCACTLANQGWFFVRIQVEMDNLRLYYNLHAGHQVYLQQHVRAISFLNNWEFVSQGWPPAFKIYPLDILAKSPEQLIRFFNLYRVFS